MNVNSGDALLQSIKAATVVKTTGIMYGDDIDLKAAGLSLEGRLKARFIVDTTFTTSAETSTLKVFSAATAAPTVVVAAGLPVAHSLMVSGKILEVDIPGKALLQYVRLGIVNSNTAAAGTALFGDLVPIKS